MTEVPGLSKILAKASGRDYVFISDNPNYLEQTILAQAQEFGGFDYDEQDQKAVWNGPEVELPPNDSQDAATITGILMSLTFIQSNDPANVHQDVENYFAYPQLNQSVQIGNGDKVIVEGVEIKFVTETQGSVGT